MSDSDPDIPRLSQAMQKARRVLQRAREERREAVRQYVGKHWGEDGATDKVPVNLISLYASVVGRTLVPSNPRLLLSTFDQSAKAPVASMQKWANKQVEEIRLAETLRRLVLDALFNIGICKVSLIDPALSSSLAWKLPAGEPFADRVDLDDFVFDVHARDFREVSFIGHRYRVPLDSVKDSRLYSKGRKDLQPSYDSPYNLEGDERTTAMGRMPLATDDEEFEDMVDLWEVYLPRRRLVLTLPDDYLSGSNAATEPLRAQKFLGPPEGPYHVLALGVVPGNAMPKAPIQDLIDLHELVNRLYRKLGRQAERQKEVLLVAGGGTDDGSRIQEANDGDIIRCDNPERSKAANYGGPNAVNQAFAGVMKDLFGYMAGNIDMMGGLSPQSKTLGQDQLLAQNASKALAEMQDRTVTFATDVSKALLWYWWHHPELIMHTQHDVPGVPGISVPVRVTPQQRSQSFAALGIKVDPYSMQHQTPQMRMQSLNQMVQTVILPMMPLLQQQGVQFDLDAYLRKAADYLDMPDLGDIVMLREPPAQDGEAPGAPEGPGMPPQTERRYVRENVPARTERGNNLNMVNALMGIDGGGAHESNGEG